MGIKIWFLTLITSLALLPRAQGRLRIDANRVDEECSYPYSCSKEVPKDDERPLLAVQQPTNAEPVQGLCNSTIPRAQNYMARPTYLECGGGVAVHQRGPHAHSQENLDTNYTLISNNHREEAQKILLAKEGWTDQIRFPVQENWVYKFKKGDYIDCRNFFGSEGGEPEPYQTTCYRKSRQEKVRRHVITLKRTCEEFTEPPPPDPSYDSGDYNYTPSTAGSGNGGSTGTRKTSPPPSTTRSQPSAPKGRGEGYQEKKNRKTGQDKWGFTSSRFTERVPAARGLRKVADRMVYTEGSSGSYGCDRWSDYYEIARAEETLDVEADSLEYSCWKTRNKWCTWFEDKSASQACPEQKTATLETRYVTPSDWNPTHPRYDDQLPNKFDLLYGELEGVKVQANRSTALSTSMQPQIEIANLLPGRTQTWNRYETKIIPQQRVCEYKDQSFKIEITPVERNVQPAPNPLQVPKDENGNIIAFTGDDGQGRPALLNLINPARQQVLDRSNLSRIFGIDPSAINDDSAAKAQGGYSKKFWEHTRFWMKLYWKDQDIPVQVTQGNSFDINNANPVAEWLEISLLGENGVNPFYRTALPFEDLLKIFGTEVSLDPNKEYYLEIKVTQPGFDKIYLSGLKAGDPTVPDEEKKVTDKLAYSEALVIPLKAPHSKPGLWDQFWHWRSSRMKRF